jgi:hypothetical protein
MMTQTYLSLAHAGSVLNMQFRGLINFADTSARDLAGLKGVRQCGMDLIARRQQPVSESQGANKASTHLSRSLSAIFFLLK